MLTLTQYQALKSWPKDSTQNELEKLGLIRPFKHPLTGRIVAMTPNYPDCIDAIREYEAAHGSGTQAGLKDGE